MNRPESTDPKDAEPSSPSPFRTGVGEPSRTVPPRTTIPLDTTRPMWVRVLLLAWPVAVQQLLVLAVNIYDLILAGRNQPADPSLHVQYQNALTTAVYLSWFASTLSYLVSVGATAVVARMFGSGDRSLANVATHQSLILATVVGIGFSMMALSILPGLIGLLGLSGASADMAVRFLEPILWLLMFQMIETTGLACLVGAGDTRITLYVLGGVAIVNIPLSWALLHGWGPFPEMGFPGIMMGTALSHAFGGLAVLAVLFVGRAGLRLHLSRFVPDRSMMRRLLRVSVPAFIDSFSLCAFQLWFLSLINGLNDPAAAAAHGIAIRTEAMGYLLGMAFGTAAASTVGQNLGAGRPADASRGGWTAFGWGCAVMSLAGAIYFTFASELFELFCPYPHQRPIVEVGAPVLRLVAFAMPPLAAAIVFTHALRGAGDTRWPVLFTWIGFLVIRIPLAYYLMYGPPQMGLLGAWMAMVVDLFIRGGFFLWRFASGRWHAIRV